MKSEKGLTLTSLLVYVIILLILTGVISTFTKYFYNNSNELIISNNTNEQYSKMLSYISEDVNSDKISSVEVSEESDYINMYFLNDILHQYVYDKENNRIYYLEIKKDGTIIKKIELCSKIDSCKFEYSETSLKIEVKINDVIYNDKFEF